MYAYICTFTHMYFHTHVYRHVSTLHNNITYVPAITIVAGYDSPIVLFAVTDNVVIIDKLVKKCTKALVVLVNTAGHRVAIVQLMVTV